MKINFESIYDNIFLFIYDIFLHIYYILIDIFYYKSFAIFNGNGKTPIEFIINCLKNFYIKRYNLIFYYDLWNKTILSNVNKYILVRDGLGITRKCLNFGSYDYLGLNQKELNYNSEEIFKYTNKYWQNNLIDTLKIFTKFEYIILDSSGFSTNALNLSKIIGNNIVISDELNHASIVEGLRWNYLTNTKTTNFRYIFKHNDIDNLKNILDNLKNDSREIFVVIEGIYSMHGHFPNIPEIIKLKSKYNFKIIVDEAHSFCSIGDNYLGSFDYFKIDLSNVDIYIATFSKTLNGNGGFIGTNNIEYYNRINKTNDKLDKLSSITCYHLIQNFKFIKSPEGIINYNNLKNITLWAYDEFIKNNFKIISEKGSPVICIDIGWANQACQLFRYTFHNNLALVMIGYPASSLLKLTLRICICSYHTKEDIYFLISVLKKKPNKIIQNKINQLELKELSYTNFNNLNEVINNYGIGSSGPHAFYGNVNICKNVEQIIASKFKKENCLITQHSLCGAKSIFDFIKSIDTEYINIEETNLENIDFDINKNYCINLSYLVAKQYVTNKNYNWEKFKKSKYIIIDLNLTFNYIIEILNLNNNIEKKSQLENNLDIKGCIFISDENIIYMGRYNIKSYLFSAVMPAYNYYNIGKFFEQIN